MTTIRKSPSGVFLDVGAGDDKVKISGADTTPDFLAPKITAGSGITLSIQNPGLNETLNIAVTGGTEDHKLSITAADTTADFLGPKVTAGSGISLAIVGGASQQLQITALTQTGDHKVGVSGTDAVPDFLSAKLVAGTGITLTPLAGPNEHLRIDAPAAVYPVPDNVFAIDNAADATKLLKTDLSAQATGTTVTIRTTNTVSRPFKLPDISGTALVAEDVTGQVFVGANVSLFASNAGIQYSSLVANRAVVRVNQFGSNTGIPGIAAFKSRGTTIGDTGTALAACVAGDGLFRVTAIGVTGNGTGTPDSALWNIKVATGGVAATFLSSEEELELTNLAGVRQVARKTTSEGELWAKGPLGPGGATGPRWRTGSGSPEGIVTGSVGDLYSDVAGAPNTTLYIKETGTATNTGWRAVASSIATAASTYTWGAGSVGSTTSTRFLFPCYEDDIAPLVGGVIQVPFPALSGKVKNLFIRQGGPAGNGNNIVYTLRKNGVATTLAVTIASTATQASDTNAAHTVTVAQGDVLDIQVTKAADVLLSPTRVVATVEIDVP